MLVRPRAWVTASATSSGLRVSGALQPRHRDPLPQARQEARAGLKRGVGSGNHCLMRADSPEKRAHALSLALGKPLLVLLRFRCPCLLVVGDALFQGKRSSLLRLRRSARCQGQPALEGHVLRSPASFKTFGGVRRRSPRPPARLEAIRRHRAAAAPVHSFGATAGALGWMTVGLCRPSPLEPGSRSAATCCAKHPSQRDAGSHLTATSPIFHWAGGALPTPTKEGRGWSRSS